MYLLLLLVAACSERYLPPLINPASLKALPVVHSVELRPTKAERTRQLIHIENWHFVEREAFIADLKTEVEKRPSEDQIEERWQAFLDEVEAVQGDQEGLLRELVKSHGVKAVFLEGLTDSDLEGYRKLARALKNWKEPAGDDALSEFLRQQHRQDSPLLGAASRVEGLDVRPAEDAEAMEAANPVRDGRIKPNDAATEHRENAMVEKILASGSPVVVLLLGGGHDLTNNVPDDVEIVRVTVKGYAKLIGESTDSPLNRTLDQGKN